MPSDDLLTDTQWIWLQCQILLDDGGQLCPACELLGVGTYCTACGSRFVPEERPCDHCSLPATGAYCQHCGHEVQSLVAAQIEAGTFDWDAWAKDLTPFLGGLSAQEEALLARG